jgi:mono/diheme cytochrome c family protein
MACMTTRTLWAILLAACVVSSEAALTQTRTPPLPSISIDSLAGRDSFDLYCASCHGTGGGGNGPVATELRTRPADLTALAQRNNGAFPRDQVRAVVAGQGRALSAHGTTEMPVWGPMFRMFESDARVRERIENLVTHLESLQRPTTRAGDPGAQVFRTYCASCHGTTARGNGPLADQLRHAPPDLTQFSTRNGGVFPSERLTRIIDGREVAAHGDRTMPVWGDAFLAAPGGLTQDQVNARITAIVKYLRGIQERPAE